MVESALNIAAEQVVEWSAYGNLMQRDGNRSPLAAPQGSIPAPAASPAWRQWLALSVATDAQWRALRSRARRARLGDGLRASTPAPGRRAAHDAIDERLREWTRTRERAELVAELRALGHSRLRGRGSVPAPRRPIPSSGRAATSRRPSTRSSAPMPLPSLPFRYAGIERWLRTPAPTIGQHNEQVLCGILGLSADDLRDLESEGVIATRPEGL